MTASLLKFFKSGPTAPRVVLLPDHRFFVRSLAVGDSVTTAEVASLVELSLETLSPFPPAQLYYGYCWAPGAPQALVFASYRKRFTAEQTMEWGGAEFVAPAFATLFGVAHEPATTLLVPSADGLTAICWESGVVPSLVLTRSLAPDATDQDRAQARDELLRAAGASRAVIDLSAPPEIMVSPEDQVLLFRAGDFTARLPVAAAAALDVRDKGELAALRQARVRDLVLWRVFAAAAAGLALLLAGELALVGIGRPWQQAQAAQVAAQRPEVERIETARTLATRIEDLSTKRLLPVEMISLAKLSPAQRGSITFQKTSASITMGLYTLRIEAQTPNPGELDVYRNRLKDLPAIVDVRVDNPQSRNGVTTFVLTITFRPEAVKASSPS
ncbi:MAG: hypothetical protein EXS39_01760 [Opitutaceae bacterium]|nr:hypothetical protein [Opitutaceae bacterium]